MCYAIIRPYDVGPIWMLDIGDNTGNTIWMGLSEAMPTQIGVYTSVGAFYPATITIVGNPSPVNPIGPWAPFFGCYD